MAGSKKVHSTPQSKIDKQDKQVKSKNEAKGDVSTKVKVNKPTKNGADKVEKNNNLVTRSTLYFTIIFSLVFGAYLGTLFPSFVAEPHIVNNTQVPAEVPPETIKNILALEQVVIKNPEDTVSWISLGNLYFDTHKHDDAIKAYEKSLELKPDNADVLTDLGIMYRSIGQYEKAVENFVKANKVDPKHENSLFNSGVVLYFDLNRKEEGRDKWRALLKVNPNAKAPDGKTMQELIAGDF